ncbi:MAG: fatty acid desaturase [Alphaproteobacteria bacterium]|nr:fatty acid desaturase [Alphaproteobacteria bacterium]
MPVNATPDQLRPDLDEFFEELAALEAELRASLGPEDLAHLRRIERWGRACTAAGWATAWMGPNPASAALLALGRTARWTTVAHHVSHGGYDRLPQAPDRLTRRGFARGWRRLVDWLDVIPPEGWHAEHNQLHHARLGEHADPDLVEKNLDWLRASGLPLPARYALVGVMASLWKWIYYAPNTLQEGLAAAAGPGAERRPLLDPAVWSPTSPDGRALWRRCFLPYAAVNFAALPALFAPLGPGAVASAATNSLLAELITNLHTFVIITTNHVGDDVWAFDTPPDSREAFVLRQILGSVNYRTGGDLNDFLHGWLNYQIEHHVWPDMSMLQYRRAQPRLQALCARHGVPYVQEGIGTRLRKTLRVMVGTADMRR